MNNQIESVITSALNNIKGLADIGTVIGKPFVNADGTTVIPVSKVTVGVLCGGGEYSTDKQDRHKEDYPFSAGSGAAVSMTPMGFLVQSRSGEYQILPIQPRDPYAKLLEAAVSLVKKGTEGFVSAMKKKPEEEKK